MLDIISVGPGEAVLLTDDAKQAIDRADAGGQMACGRDIHIVFRQNTRCKRCSFPRQTAVDGCRLPHAAEDKRVWRTFRTGKLH